MPKALKFLDIVGPHPEYPHPCGLYLEATDDHSDHKVPHRSLTNPAANTDDLVEAMKGWIKTHHAKPEDLARDKRRREALAREGYALPTSRFPTNLTTQKCNWGEIFLAEYLSSACNSQLPVYRLRYNPNVEQSMKGDDVLLFDLDSDPVRLIVAESKFRGIPSKNAVEEIIDGLERSHRSGIPSSLQFVANRLYGDGNNNLGEKVEECCDLFVRGKLRIDNVGLLVSNSNASANVKRNAKTSVHRLAMISLGLSNPAAIIEASFKGLESDL